MLVLYTAGFIQTRKHRTNTYSLNHVIVQEVEMEETNRISSASPNELDGGAVDVH